jgi:autotransporter translocation and assembly factor TamB
VDVPWARITVQEVPESATGVSSDEVMLGITKLLLIGMAAVCG